MPEDIKKYKNLFLEPVSSTKPKFPTDDIHTSLVRIRSSFQMLCPAQGYPVSSYRLVLNLKFGI